MKLTKDIKEKIDKYFDNITAEDLLDVAVKKYGFTINNDIEIKNQSFDVIKTMFCKSNIDNSIETTDNSNLPFAA